MDSISIIETIKDYLTYYMDYMTNTIIFIKNIRTLYL